MKWNDRLPVFVLFFSLLLMLSESCRPDKGKNIPDVSDIQIELKISRFEKDLLAQDTSDIDLSTIVRELDGI